jgi:hypothetical protein
MRKVRGLRTLRSELVSDKLLDMVELAVTPIAFIYVIILNGKREMRKEKEVRERRKARYRKKTKEWEGTLLVVISWQSQISLDVIACKRVMHNF